MASTTCDACDAVKSDLDRFGQEIRAMAIARNIACVVILGKTTERAEEDLGVVTSHVANTQGVRGPTTHRVFCAQVAKRSASILEALERAGR